MGCFGKKARQWRPAQPVNAILSAPAALKQTPPAACGSWGGRMRLGGTTDQANLRAKMSLQLRYQYPATARQRRAVIKCFAGGECPQLAGGWECRAPPTSNAGLLQGRPSSSCCRITAATARVCA